MTKKSRVLGHGAREETLEGALQVVKKTTRVVILAEGRCDWNREIVIMIDAVSTGSHLPLEQIIEWQGLGKRGELFFISRHSRFCLGFSLCRLGLLLQPLLLFQGYH